MTLNNFKFGEKAILPFFLALFLLNASASYAQKHEFGAFLGGQIYKGELNPNYNPLGARPYINPFFRINFSPAVTWRNNISLGIIAGDVALSQSPMFEQVTPSSFSSFNGILSTMIEYNFLRWRAKVRPDKISPYILVGAGVQFFQAPKFDDTEAFFLQPIIPIGAGIKVALNKNWNFNMEFGVNKIFTGLLDGRNSNLPERSFTDPRTGLVTNLPQPQTGYSQNQDWLGFFGIGFSYTIITIDCPKGTPDPSLDINFN